MWADAVLSFSSEQNSEGLGAHQLVGPPRVFPIHGHVDGAWSPAPASGSAKQEWVEVGFREALYVSAVELYETYHAGAVTSIALWAGEQHGWDVVWKGEAQQQQLPSEARLFSPPIAARPYATRFLRVEMSVAPHPNGTHLAAQIDAIRVLGLKASEDPALGSPPLKYSGGASRGRGASALSNGPRFRRAEEKARKADARVGAEREAHEREVSHLRGYINKLRAGYDSMRTELDAKAASLEKAQALIRAIQDEPYDAAADPNSIGDPSCAVSRDPPPPVPAPPPM